MTRWLAKSGDSLKERTMTMNRFALALVVAAVASMGVTGCATKKFVHLQTAPLIEHENQLDKQTAENASQIKDLDGRTQAGIGKAQGTADQALQAAQNASQQAQAAQQTADGAVHRVDSLEAVVKGLDNYKLVAEVSVTFASGQALLGKDAQAQLDGFAAKVAPSGYILEVTGTTDSRGSAALNYQLSQKRATAVVAYLAAKHNIPAHRFYLIGLGKDKQVAANNTAAGRQQNRQVTVQLLSNQTR
jgi:outer membrane protein OmpA-like peptidoglycan-associated protein